MQTAIAAPLPSRKRQTKNMAAEAVPAYVFDDDLSFRHGLRARERAIIDRALHLVSGPMRKREALASPGAVKQYLMLQLAGEQHEIFGVLYLDVQNRAIAFDALFRGTLAQTSVYPREVVLRALHHSCAAVILAHNHPSGNVQPSRSDVMLTQTLQAALALVDVRVLDHIIVAPGTALSMAERGLL